MDKMKVVYIDEPGKIRVTESDIPVPGKDEALLKVLYCGICGSDVATYTGNQPFTTYPRIPGHEFSAEIAAVNSNRTDLKPGMIVTANPYFNCGHCYSCRRGLVNCCEDNKTMGVQRDGSFAGYIRMPVERVVNGIGLPADLLALVEPFSISYHAIKRGDVCDRDKVLVIGAGPIGIFAMMAAKLRGAMVYIADVLDARLRLAMEMGADGIINPSRESLPGRVKDIAVGNGMDVCVEAAGLPQTFLDCIENVCFAGKVILIGNGKKETTFNHSIVLKKELDIYGSRNSLNDFEAIIRLINAGKLDLMRIVTDVYGIDDVADAFEALKTNDGTKAKVLVKF